MSPIQKTDPTRPPHDAVVPFIGFALYLFSTAWVGMLLLGAVHGSAPIVPALGYLATVALFYVGALITGLGTATGFWRVEQRTKTLGAFHVAAAEKTWTPLAAALRNRGSK